MPFVAGWEIGRLHHQMNLGSLILGMILYIFSVTVSIWAMSFNPFFEPSVRIKKDRNHRVISNGPYGLVRHPGYSAVVLWSIAFPLVVGSIYAFYQAFFLIIFIALRTNFEDKTLQNELDGYLTYIHNVEYRLIPGIW